MNRRKCYDHAENNSLSRSHLIANRNAWFKTWKFDGVFSAWKIIKLAESPYHRFRANHSRLPFKPFDSDEIEMNFHLKFYRSKLYVTRGPVIVIMFD